MSNHEPSDQPAGFIPPTVDPQFVVELPNEIQRLVFEYAASLDGKCAFRLCQVARYVYAWVHPILYQRVVIQSPQSAISFFQTLRSNPRGYFEPMIKSLTFDSTVTLPQAKALLVECSRRILLLTIFRKGSSKERILDYVKSPYLKRLTMVCHRDWPVDAQWPGQPNAQYDIPLGMVASLTHLAIVVDYGHGSWLDLSSAELASSYPNNPTYVTAYSAFQNLTHFATSTKSLELTWRIMRVAQKLQYFAILEPRNFSSAEHEQLVKRIRMLAKDPRYLAVLPGRSVVILKDLGDPDMWKAKDSFRPSDFWKKVEQSVDEGCILD